MQILYHKSPGLTIIQKFFIERSIELLYRSTIDSYRVRVKNPKTILNELRETIFAYERGQIKHFIAIASTERGKYALKDEALDLLESQPNYLRYQTFSNEYFISVLKTLDEKNYKRVRDCLGVLLKENKDYLSYVLTGLMHLLNESPETDLQLTDLLKKIDTTLSILYTELLEIGFSKGFLYRFIYGVFVNSSDDINFDAAFTTFTERLTLDTISYTIIFRIDTTNKIKESFQTIDDISNVCSELEDLNHLEGNKEFDNFVAPRLNRCYVKCRVSATDYLSALKKAKASLAENLDVLNLGFGDEHLHIHSRVLVVDESNPTGARFQESKNFLDGKYRVAQDHYQNFIDKLPTIVTQGNINRETKEKIKSAIRYLRLGNESTEVEHKSINYWIGLEYLFSNYESVNTINRIKDYFVACHSLSYVKRNAFDFHKTISKLEPSELDLLNHYNNNPIVCLQNPEFYTEVASAFCETHPLISFRAQLLRSTLCSSSNQNEIKKYVERHQKNLIIHLTRIYRLRNEIVHDAATNTNNESIASNLRYYLTFILNGVIHYLSRTDNENASIEDYFTMNEIYLGNISYGKWNLENLLKVDTPIDFIH
ncbi:hypothetical protein [Olivibacter domesticus]|uniref:Apea-like HEPN domain-containing protein n=1 Tax=Olivibacter domesticus TaxID=407022 RepID=A0A1H7KK23_OLID1|nr:hypothetical protein [Olivibacter domesticus]SEK87138.1 hypothetical protein SAMN05661044_01381 [Olivibacter domesticus]